MQKRYIGSRLEGWARWATGKERAIGVSPTGAACDRMRKDALGEEPRQGERRSVDEHDAWAIEQAMQKLTPQHRALLKLCYIKQDEPHIVCKKLGIPVRPSSHFVDLFHAAQDAVERLTDLHHNDERIAS